MSQSSVASPSVFTCFTVAEEVDVLILRMQSGPSHSSDTEGYRTLRDEVSRAIRTYRKVRVIVDFDALAALTADAFGIFDHIRHTRRTVILSGLNDDLREKLALAGFTPFLLADTVDEAKTLSTP